MRSCFHVLMLYVVCLLLTTPGHAQAAPVKAQDGDGEILVMLRLQNEHYRAEGGFGGGYGSGSAQVGRRHIAERLAQAHGLHLVDNWPMPLVGVDCFIMQSEGAQTPDTAIAALMQDKTVAWAQPVQNYHTLASAKIPNDPLWRLQPAANNWRLADLHKLAQGRGVHVAVIDSGVDMNHPDLKGQVDTFKDFVAGHPGGGETHGTAVAGVIAALADNGMGMAGIAPAAKLMSLRACWQKSNGETAGCDSFSLAKALQYAIDHGARIINLSLGGPPDRLLGMFIDVALTRGIAVVAAVDPALPGGGFPASHGGVYAVSDEEHIIRARQLYCAPGRDVPATTPGGHWGLMNGTSFAAAHVSGLLALMAERFKTHRPWTIRQTRSCEIDAWATLSGAVSSHL